MAKKKSDGVKNFSRWVQNASGMTNVKKAPGAKKQTKRGK